ncbi:MAG: hypothetical protein ACTHM1_11500 [Solirubrobacteraceae bacterium]
MVALAARRSEVARCTVERFMAKDSLQGAVDGKKRRITIFSYGQAESVPDLVDRDFTALARTGYGRATSRMSQPGRA